LKKSEGNSLCIRSISVAYLGSQKATKFNKETTITNIAIFEVPKPPAQIITNSKLDQVAKTVLPPQKDKTPIEEFNDKLKLVDIKVASTK